MTDLQYGSEPASGHYIPGTFSNINTMLSVTLSQEAILVYDELKRFAQQFGCQLLCSKDSWDIHHNIEHLHEGQQENIGKEVDHLLTHYHTEMKSIDAQLDPQTQQQQQRLRHICHLIQQLERFHPFTDGNGRTFRNILLNHLLKQNGFPPALQYNTSHVEMYSLDDYCKDVQYSMLTAQTFKVAYDQNPINEALFHKLIRSIALRTLDNPKYLDQAIAWMTALHQNFHGNVDAVTQSILATPQPLDNTPAPVMPMTGHSMALSSDTPTYKP
ncbi:MAG: hypothetical protein CMF51_03005 [Legionellales bacterium]|nr:hypothetical protein [Legionellales bacterium]